MRRLHDMKMKSWLILLVMLLAGLGSIREAVLFPQLRPEEM